MHFKIIIHHCHIVMFVLGQVNLEVDEQMEEVVENVAEHVGMDVAEEKTDQGNVCFIIPRRRG